MATRKVTGKKSARRRKELPPITVLHIHKALAHIETWIYYVRRVLAHLDPSTAIPIPRRDRDAKVLRRVSNVKWEQRSAGDVLGPVRIFKLGCMPTPLLRPPTPGRPRPRR